MVRKLVLEFTKMHGAGNDFVVLDNRFYSFADGELSDLAGRLCRRRFGVGADGLLALSNPRSAEAAFRMVYYNADGSRGSMCGNGARCLVRFAVEAGIRKPAVRFETDDGFASAETDPDDPSRVKLFLPDPTEYAERTGVAVPAAAGATSDIARIDTGVPHAVCFVGSVDEVPVAAVGSVIRHDSHFAQGANVDFVETVGAGAPSRIRVRTFERGVEAETLACGTGAVASAVTAWLTGRVKKLPVEVDMPGGRLLVGFEPKAGGVADVYLEGPAEVVFRGSLEL